MAMASMAQSVFPRSVTLRAPSHGVRSRSAMVTMAGPKVGMQGTGRAAMEMSRAGSLSSSSLMGDSLWRTLSADLGAGSRSRSRSHGRGGAMGASCSIYVGGYGITPETVRWCVAAACAVLLLKRDAGAKKQFWAGILALEAPRDVLYWAKSEYGLWVACIGLALKIFYNVPAELDYPLAVYLFLVSLPAQAMSLRGTVGAAVVSAGLALFVAYQYFYNTVRVSDAFKGEHLVNTILIVFTALACLWFFGLTVF